MLLFFSFRKLREAFDSCDTNRKGELCISGVLDAYYKLTNRSLGISELYSYLSTSMSNDPTRLRVSFEQFCALVAEYCTDGCDTYTTTDGRFLDPLYWTSALLKTRHLLRFYLIRPITSALGISCCSLLKLLLARQFWQIASFQRFYFITYLFFKLHLLLLLILQNIIYNII